MSDTQSTNTNDRNHWTASVLIHQLPMKSWLSLCHRRLYPLLVAYQRSKFHQQFNKQCDIKLETHTWQCWASLAACVSHWDSRRPSSPRQLVPCSARCGWKIYRWLCVESLSCSRHRKKHLGFLNQSTQELIRRWDIQRELLRSAPGSYPNSLK